MATNGSDRKSTGSRFGNLFSRAGRASGAAHAVMQAAGLENLEQRVMMSADLPVGGGWLDWGGSRVAVEQGAFIVSFDEALSRDNAELFAREVASRLGVTATSVESVGSGYWAAFRTNGQVNFNAAVALVRDMPLVKGIEPNLLYKSERVSNDIRAQDQWWINNTGQFVAGVGQGTPGASINVIDAWDTTIGSRSTVVAVIDTGVDYTHPDLTANMWRNPGETPGNGIDDDGNGFVDDVFGFDFGDFDADPLDDSNDPGHGTAVAGVIGASGNNNLGVVGVNWNVSIMAIKVANRFGALTAQGIIASHDYVTMMRNRGVNVVASNNSYGTYAPAFFQDAPEGGFQAERDAIQRFINSGGVFVAAAGNDSIDNDNPDSIAFPASYNIPGMITVAATTNTDTLAGFSNFGAQTVDLGAPGEGILTTAIGGTYQLISGTSFSSPMVAGTVALLKSVYPNASPVAIREAILNSVDQLATLQGRVRSGGRLNVSEALRLLGIEGPAVRAFNPGPVTGQLDANTNNPVNSITIDFTRDINASLLTGSAVLIVGDGPDNIFGTGDDVNIPISGNPMLSNVDPRRVTINLNLASFALQRLPFDTYRLTLAPNGFRDTDGRFLNGNAISGTQEQYTFRVVATTGDNEPNDSLAQATLVAFDTSGQARFTGITLGNGLFAGLDVDLYRIDLPRGGLITAETFARRPGLSAPSTLDTFLRLFNAQGQQIAANDQTVAQDSLIDFFVTTGGTYYIGVSGFGNANYNPNVAGSGTNQSTGTYELRLGVQLANDDVRSFSSTGDTTLPRRVPVADNQTQGVTTAFIDVNDSRQILDLNVRINITHTFNSDLEISVIAPNGTTILLSNRRGGAGQNFTNTVFDDEGGAAIANGTAPFTGIFRPDQSLGTVDGLTGAGRWTLRINDAVALNSGQLNSWQLDFTFQNDIFGPFESNDTIATARDVAEINGTGSATRTAFLGDGGFGALDRDIFRFVANAGTTLTATVTPTGAFNSAFRLFDATGTQILVSNPLDSNVSRVESFVFATGGTYFIAVSEASNINYNPNTIAGTPAATTGTYTLDILLAAGVSDGATVLTGTNVSLGVSTSGNYSAANATGQNVGLRFNNIDFLPTSGGRPQMFFGGVANGFNFTNAGPTGTSQVPFALTSQSDTFNNRLTTKGEFRGLQVERAFSFGQNDSFIAIDVYLRNSTPSQLANVAWMEGFNPDPGQALGENDNRTINTVSQRMVTARYVNNEFLNGLTVGIAAPAADGRATAKSIAASQSARDPFQLANIPDSSGVQSTDSQLALNFNLGSIESGQVVTLRYFIFFGTDPTGVDSQYAQVNNGTGAGHLTANSATPANTTLSNGANVPQLPYRLYFPDGFVGSQIFTFLPIVNASDQNTRVVVVARYEKTSANESVAMRDQVVSDFTITANNRSGLTLVTPEQLANGTALLTRLNAPYSLEIWSERPVAATFSHYDLALVQGNPAAAGESFTTRTSTTWSFGRVTKGNGEIHFVPIYNTTDTQNKVTVTFFPLSGQGPTISVVRTLDAFRRGGIAPDTDADLAGLASGDYGVTLSAERPIVAALTQFNTTNRTAESDIGNTGLGVTTGVIAEGQFGLNPGSEKLGVLNPTTTAATVVFSFIFTNGSAYRTSLAVPARSYSSLDVGSLPNFPTGLPYGVFFESNTAVSVNSLSTVFNDSVAGNTADRAFTLWGFGEGFRPSDTSTHPGVTEYLRLYNPASIDTVIEITISYDQLAPGSAGLPATETFRRTLPARRISNFDVDQFITGQRRNTNAFFGITIKAPTPIVSYMGHFDRAFPGAFGSLGTPLGSSAAIT